MKDFASTINPRVSQVPSSRTINVNCAAAPVAADPSGFLPSFQGEVDQYLASEAKPFLSVPIWVWIGLAGLAGWYFWGRKHFKVSFL